MGRVMYHTFWLISIGVVVTTATFTEMIQDQHVMPGTDWTSLFMLSIGHHVCVKHPHACLQLCQDVTH